MNIYKRIQALQELLEQDWLTIREAQMYADRSESSLYRLIRQNKLVSMKNKSGRTFIKRESIDKWHGVNIDEE